MSRATLSTRSTDQVIQALRAEALRAFCRVIREGAYGLSNLGLRNWCKERPFGWMWNGQGGVWRECLYLRVARVSSPRSVIESAEQARPTAQLKSPFSGLAATWIARESRGPFLGFVHPQELD